MKRNMKNMEKPAMKSLPMTMRKREMMLTVATRTALARSSANASFMAGQKLRPFMATMMKAFLCHTHNTHRRQLSTPPAELEALDERTC